MRTAYDSSTKTHWATASFFPSARASAAVLVGFQDSGSRGVFSKKGNAQWKMVGFASQPAVSCSASLPAAVRRAWHASSSECTQVSRARTSSGRTASPDTSGPADPATIADLAKQNVGVGDTPASTSFSQDCNPFTTMVGVGASTAGCGVDPTFGVQDQNEEWCADFNKWVWEHGGVTADLSTLDPSAASFYQWAVDQGENPVFDSGTPQVGDAIVFYPGSDTAPNATFADHVGLVVGINSNGTLNLVNGDFAGSSNITVQANTTSPSISSWAGSIWGTGEQWIYVSPVGSETAFQANTGDQWIYTPTNTGDRDTGLGMAKGTSPSIAPDSSGGFETAFQANTGDLWIYTPTDTGNRDTGLGMAAGTSPSIADSSSEFETAFQANTGALWLDTPSGNVDTDLGMASGTSPAIADSPSGFETAFQANTGDLWLYTPTNAGDRDTGLGMAPGTSPAIAPDGSGFEVAFQANTGALWLDTPTGNVDTGLGMAPGTSPSIVDGEVAFQANTGDLWVYTPANSGNRDTGLGMAAETSPSIGADGEVAFQANTGDLWLYTPANSGNRNTGLGMGSGTSPAIAN
jgi:CHAP domain